MDSAKGSPPVALDSAGRVAQDVPCRSCGYNLRGLSPDGQCPECKAAVGRSIRGDLLRHCDPNWVQRLARGVSWIIASILLAIFLWLVALLFDGRVIVPTPLVLSSGFGLVLVIVGTVIGVTHTGSSRPFGLVLVIVGVVLAVVGLLFGYTETAAGVVGFGLPWVWRIVIPVMGLVGSWMVTSPEPGAAAAERRLSPRRVARYTIVAWVLRIPFEVFLLLPIARALGIGPLWMRVPFIPWRQLTVLQVILGAAAYVALCIHMRKLALRVPNRSLARQTRIVMWAPPALGLPLALYVLYFASRGTSVEDAYALAVAFGFWWRFMPIPLITIFTIFTIWTFVLLCLYRKALRQAARNAKETWAAPAQPKTT